MTTPKRDLTGTRWETAPGERWDVVAHYGDIITVERVGTETRYHWDDRQLERFKAKEVAK